VGDSTVPGGEERLIEHAPGERIALEYLQGQCQSHPWVMEEGDANHRYDTVSLAGNCNNSRHSHSESDPGISRASPAYLILL